MKNNSKEIMPILDEYIENPKCTLEFNKDYELLIATMLSAQTTDARVNIVTKELFSKYDIYDLAKLEPSDVYEIIRPVGNGSKKSIYLISIAKSLVENYDGHVPQDRTYLESLSGVGHKTANVVLANLFNEPTFAVDTHVERVSKRLNIASDKDDVLTVEKKLMKYFPKDKWIKLHHQLLLFGRHFCKSQNPLCEGCKLKPYCKFKKCSK